MTSVGDRIAGLAACATALAVALAATRFRVGFYTDPLGPGALPYFAAALLGAGGLALVVRPAIGSARPGTAVARRMAIVFASLVAYASLLPLFGFLLSTSAILVILSRTFGGPLLRSVFLSALYVGALYLVFAVLLGLSLPVGSLFLIGP